MFNWDYYSQTDLLLLSRYAAPSPKGSHYKYTEPQFALSAPSLPGDVEES